MLYAENCFYFLMAWSILNQRGGPEILKVLSDYLPHKPIDISNSSGVDQRQVHRILDKLVDLKLAEKKRDMDNLNNMCYKLNRNKWRKYVVDSLEQAGCDLENLLLEGENNEGN